VRQLQGQKGQAVEAPYLCFLACCLKLEMLVLNFAEFVIRVEED